MNYKSPSLGASFPSESFENSGNLISGARSTDDPVLMTKFFLEDAAALRSRADLVLRS